MFRAPRPAQLPHLHTMLDNIARSDADLARLLDISPKTIATYRKKGQAPRSVMLAFFWETVWGQSAANCDAVNWGRLQFQENHLLKRQNSKLRQQIKALELELSHGKNHAANSPLYELG